MPSRRRRQSLAVAFGGTVVLLAAVAAVGPVAVGLLRPPAPVEVQVFVTEDGANDAPVDADRSEMGTGGTGRFGGGADPDSDGDQTGVDGAEPGGTTSTRQAGRSPRVGPTVDRPQDPAGPGASAPVVAGGVLPGAVPAPTVVSRPLPDDNPPVPSDSSPVPAPTVPIIPSTEPPGPADPAPAPTTGPGPTTAPTTRPPTTAPTTRPPTTVPPPTPTPTPSTRPPSTATPPTPPTTEVTPAPSVTSPAADPGGPITAR